MKRGWLGALVTGRYKPSNQSAGQPFIIPQLSPPPGETWRVVFNKLHIQTEKPGKIAIKVFTTAL